MRKVIIDNGHGIETPGKRSPDGRLREWAWTRRLAARLAGLLGGHGIEAVILVPEERDVPLRERCRRANACDADMLLSLHVNAAGDGSRWLGASGFSAFVAPKASDHARRLAALLTAEAAKAGLAGNRYTPPEGYLSANFAICTGTRCPAVLTENLFQDNRSDVDFLLSPSGIETVARVHLDAILKFFNIRS